MRQGVDADKRFPRRRGDGPYHAQRGGVAHRFPPQARGWTRPSMVRTHSVTVSPAGAGMDPCITHTNPTNLCFPRRRGDGPWICACALYGEAFPPQARGWTPGRSPLRPRVSVSPAGAGMDLCAIGWGGECTRFPRRRGDGPGGTPQHRRYLAFPPQARGWTPTENGWTWPHEVSPAGAGMDP